MGSEGADVSLARALYWLWSLLETLPALAAVGGRPTDDLVMHEPHAILRPTGSSAAHNRTVDPVGAVWCPKERGARRRQRGGATRRRPRAGDRGGRDENEEPSPLASHGVEQCLRRAAHTGRVAWFTFGVCAFTGGRAWVGCDGTLSG